MTLPFNPGEATVHDTLKQTVLMVDDEPEFRRLLYHALKERFRIVEAADADGAIAAVKRGGIDLVLLDLHLPPRVEGPSEGLRAQHRIGELDGGLPVVAVTADRDPELRRLLEARGVRRIVPKPVDVPGLSRLLEELLTT